MRPLRYSINVTLDGCCDHRAMVADEDLHRHAVENLGQADALLSLRAVGPQGDHYGRGGHPYTCSRSRGENRRSSATPIRGCDRGCAGGLLVIGDPLIYSLRRQIADLSVKARLATMYPGRDYTEEGGLMSYGINRRQIYWRAAEYVDRILKGAKPGALPIERPTKFELVINLRAAKALGVTIPRSLLLQADEVIE